MYVANHHLGQVFVLCLVKEIIYVLWKPTASVYIFKISNKPIILWSWIITNVKVKVGCILCGSCIYFLSMVVSVYALYFSG